MRKVAMETEAKELAQLIPVPRTGGRTSHLADIEREKAAIARNTKAKAHTWATKMHAQEKNKKKGKTARVVIESANSTFNVNSQERTVQQRVQEGNIGAPLTEMVQR